MGILDNEVRAYLVECMLATTSSTGIPIESDDSFPTDSVTLQAFLESHRFVEAMDTGDKSALRENLFRGNISTVEYVNDIPAHLSAFKTLTLSVDDKERIRLLACGENDLGIEYYLNMIYAGASMDLELVALRNSEDLLDISGDQG